MATALDRVLARIVRMIRLQISRCVLVLVDDSDLMQKLQVQMQGDQPVDGIEHFQPYGLTAKPHADAEGLFLRIGGAGELGVAILFADRRYELKGLATGEIALHDDQGQYVKIGRSGVHIVSAATTTVDGDLHVTGDLIADGDVTDSSGTAQTLGEMRDTFNNHTHLAPGVTTGPSSLPVPPPNSPPM